eukprot:763556-Pyramimonas_sp.AAC.4
MAAAVVAGLVAAEGDVPLRREPLQQRLLHREVVHTRPHTPLRAMKLVVLHAPGLIHVSAYSRSGAGPAVRADMGCELFTNPPAPWAG